ncbi:MAG: type I DNA topoisomerase [Candidatus Komeilibacteria bacterium]|nr:type I DNA topoisomerase [Candidatus Komeilibacteria bacterium]
MSHSLLIVESPTKAKTISKFLDKNYEVIASFGHVRDLPKSKMGIDIEHEFTPQYVIPTKAKKTVSELKKKAAKADEIYLATDEDREGEAIAWHLATILDLSGKEVKRLTFHEITKEAILNSLKTPRDLDINLVDAQQARRILDRLVGYELSPFLWKKVAKGLSAGRVQSVALRLICEREREIKAFQTEEYWTIEAEFSKDKITFTASLNSIAGKKIDKFDINNEAQAKALVEQITKQTFSIAKVEQKQSVKNPPSPFTTSTLQQRANRMLGYSAKQTMMLAQQLYEGVDLGAEGQVGLITYVIKNLFGAPYATGAKKYNAKSKLAQEAHEAIRPTDPAKTPDSIKQYLDPKQYKLYDLIWRRTLASQMPAAEILTTSVDIATFDQQFIFRASGSIITFDGFLKVLPHDDGSQNLPALAQGDKVIAKSIEPIQHFTEPPARYSEATLIKALEEYGIGRPSTYAPTIATIEARNYIIKEEKKLKPTDIGLIVNDILVEHFPKIVDYNFTAKIEDDFDQIAEGKENWVKMLKEFYGPFHDNVIAKSEIVTKETAVGMRELGTDPESGKTVSVRIGRFGPYVQKGSKDDTEKPTFASLKKDQSVATITLTEALDLLTLPKKLGLNEAGEEVLVGIGRFGPYVKIGSKFHSIKGEDPYTVTLAKALELIKTSQANGGKKIIKEFAGSDIKVVDGRYGAYITDDKKNAKIPKDTEPADLTQEQCEKLIAEAPEKKARPASLSRMRGERTFRKNLHKRQIP